MALTAAQLEARKGKLTASAIGALMSGDPAKVKELWQRMVGDPAYVEPDFSRAWPVQLGTVTEELNLDWYTVKTKREITLRGEVVVSDELPWAAATLDGWRLLSTILANWHGFCIRQSRDMLGRKLRQAGHCQGSMPNPLRPNAPHR
jgi:hypothetical protein